MFDKQVVELVVLLADMVIVMAICHIRINKTASNSINNMEPVRQEHRV